MFDHYYYGSIGGSPNDLGFDLAINVNELSLEEKVAFFSTLLDNLNMESISALEDAIGMTI